MSAEFVVDASPDRPAGEVWAAALGQLLGIVEDNLEGTLDRRDAEYLHDLRVAVRRSRSVVKFGAGVLPDDERDHLRTELKWLGAQISLPRDLDVHLLGFEEMAEHVSDPAALTPFADLLREHHEQAHRDLAEALRSPRFDRLLDAWRATSRAKGADRPVGEVAGEVLAKAARRVRQRGRAITADSPPEALHDLRKRAKELRYLLDMLVGPDQPGAASAASPKAQKALPKVKKLQKALGRHQDAVAQSRLVAQASRELRSRGASRATLTAMDELATHLGERTATARTDVMRRWATFDRLGRRTWQA